MAPASDAHGSIQSRLSQLIGVHLDARGSECRIVTAPGIVPAERSGDNCLVPDLGITCSPPTGEHLMHQPLVRIEILSPTNVSKTRANVHAYGPSSTSAKIVVLHYRGLAEVLRRAPNGAWLAVPEAIAADGELRPSSIGFAAHCGVPIARRV